MAGGKEDYVRLAQALWTCNRLDTAGAGCISAFTHDDGGVRGDGCCWKLEWCIRLQLWSLIAARLRSGSWYLEYLPKCVAAVGPSPSGGRRWVL